MCDGVDGVMAAVRGQLRRDADVIKVGVLTSADRVTHVWQAGMPVVAPGQG